MKNLLILVPLSLMIFNGCGTADKHEPGDAVSENKTTENIPAPFIPDQQWNDYWYAGKAELTSYDLKQSRYGEIHDGTVVNIFVTEDFSKSKEVKLDDPNSAGDDKVNVLKLNQSIKFNTGIYPYSLMLSTFRPVDVYSWPHALKVAATSQEWCGNSFFQLNNRNNKYEIELRSYFEHEGDKNITMDNVILEDELWNMIRIAPDKLPTGEQKILPGALYLRLSHKPMETVQVKLSLQENNGTMTYTEEFPSLNRMLHIYFEKTFPYRITGWDDTFPGLDGKPLTTTATKKKEIMDAYWMHHTNADSKLRDELGLPEKYQ